MDEAPVENCLGSLFCAKSSGLCSEPPRAPALKVVRPRRLQLSAPPGTECDLTVGRELPQTPSSDHQQPLAQMRRTEHPTSTSGGKAMSWCRLKSATSCHNDAHKVSQANTRTRTGKLSALKGPFLSSLVSAWTGDASSRTHLKAQGSMARPGIHMTVRESENPGE